MVGKIFRFVSLLFVVILLIVGAVSCGASWQDTADGGKEKIEYYADGTVKRHTIKDKDGNEITKSYNEEGTLISYREDKYDANGNHISGSFYKLEEFNIGENEYSFWTHTEQSSFDKNGIATDEKRTYYTSNGKKDKTEHFTFDRIEDHGVYYHLNSITFYNDDETISEYQEYGANNKIINSTRYNSDGTVKDYTEYEYDEKGNMIKEINYDKDGNIIE